MADEDDAQKTEEPTPKKLAKARQKGQTASSQEIKSWGILLAGAGGLIFIAPYVGDGVRLATVPYISQAHEINVDLNALQQLFIKTVFDAAVALSPFFLLVVILALAASLFQSGLIFAPEKIKFDPSKLSLLAGVKRMFSAKSFAEFLKGILKLVMVGGLAMAMTIPMLTDMELMPGMSMAAILDRIELVAILVVVSSIIVMTVIAALDFAFQKYQFIKQMRMSKQEVKDEQKQAEGDPQVKAKIRALRQQRARERMMANVPNADVVITNPTHYAVALEYKMEEMPAPKLIAKGIDELAFRIREVAEEHDVPIVENPPLARALHAAVELDEEIPTEHFVAVAEVIGYVMRLKGKTVH